MCTVGMALVFQTDLLTSSVSNHFILRAFLPVIMLTVLLFSGWYLSFDSDTMQRVPWPIPIVIRNAYYLLITLCVISLFRWFRDPVHRYFIWIQEKRIRTTHYYQHRNPFRNHLLNDQGDNPDGQYRSFMGYMRQPSSSMERQEVYHAHHDVEGVDGKPFHDPRIQRLSRRSQ